MKIEINNLVKSFNDKEVLNLNNMTFSHGLTCIMGSNGCGKTTLLNILSGQLDYEKGDIKYNGSKFTKDLSREITLVHQNPYLLNRSVYENIAYPLKLRHIHKQEIVHKVEKIMHKLNLEYLMHKKATELSIGEVQKVSIARALVFEPKLLMLDEPTSNIDEKSVGLIEKVILSYAQLNNTVIVVTHSSEQAKRLSDRIITL